MLAIYITTLVTFSKVVDQFILTLIDILTKQITLLIYINKFLILPNKESIKTVSCIVLYTGKNLITGTIWQRSSKALIVSLINILSANKSKLAKVELSFDLNIDGYLNTAKNLNIVRRILESI